MSGGRWQFFAYQSQGIKFLNIHGGYSLSFVATFKSFRIFLVRSWKWNVSCVFKVPFRDENYLGPRVMISLDDFAPLNF